MHVDDLMLEAGGERTAQNGHEAGQHDEVDPVLLEGAGNGFLKVRLAPVILLQNNRGLYARRFGPGEGVSVRFVGNHQLHFAAFDHAAFLCVQDRLQVGAPAGYQDGDARFLLLHSHASFPTMPSAGSSMPPTELPRITSAMNTIARREKLPAAAK